MVDDLQADAVDAGHAHLDGRARGVPDRVGQAFLQDPVGSPGDLSGNRADVADDVEVELDASLRRAGQEVLEVPLRERVFQGGVQQAGQPADVRGGFTGQFGDFAASSSPAAGSSGGEPLACAGLDDHDADAVRDDIVQFPGYAIAFEADGFRGELLAF